VDTALRDMRSEDVPVCASIVCASSIGERYAFERSAMGRTLAAALAATGRLFVADRGGRAAGFAWIDPQGAFSTAPYLRLIAVDETLRGSGVGSLLLAEFERRTAEVGRDWCLLVSDFNQGARAFYAKHGYREVGLLPDFARKGIAEVLMVKKRGEEPS